MAGTATATVCSMCGDVGFPEKLFRCARCRHRFQHSYVHLLGALQPLHSQAPYLFVYEYCTNYYGDGAPASAGSDTCDWCLSDAGAGNKARWSSSAAGKQHAAGSQESSSTTSSGGSGRGVGNNKASGGGGDQQQSEGRRRATTRAAGRRYKLLKDVLC
ncbi:hypothetical protein BAE44_0002493 [Dichanthelium oligosanthes]|uniref:PHD-type zinc finger plants domain-containing protein n=1 Tax=Dichanthelium oligosanthes TaxID=888268 RepID=A0A1E5WGG5_9POAL|nr:hypothetical protein BAE44_0002493 [Dichanthelium oligosanthes]